MTTNKRVRRCPDGLGGGRPEGGGSSGGGARLLQNNTVSGKMQPLGNRLILRMPAAPTKIGHIWLPPTVQTDYIVAQAEIVAVGAHVQDSRLVPGVRIVTKRFGAVAHDAAKTFWTIEETDVFAILDEED